MNDSAGTAKTIPRARLECLRRDAQKLDRLLSEALADDSVEEYPADKLGELVDSIYDEVRGTQEHP
jgi:hypothetical protein